MPRKSLQTPPPVTWPELWDKLTVCNSRLSECVDDPDFFEELHSFWPRS